MSEPAEARLPLMAVVVLCTLGALLLAGSAAAQGGDLGDTIWPPEDRSTDANLAEIGASVLAAEDPVVFHGQEIRSVDIEREDEGVSRLDIRTPDGRRSVQQEHVAPNGTTADAQLLRVRPAQITPSVEVDPAPGDRFVLQVAAPPGTFDVEGEELADRAESFAEGVGLPSAENPEQAWSRERPFDRHLTVRLFQGTFGCLERAGEDCQREAAFVVDCADCTELVRRFDPTLREEIGALTNRSVQAGQDEARLLFDGDGELVAARSSLVFDVDTSTLVDPDEAHDRASQALEDEGYPIVEDRSPEVPDDDKDRPPLGLTFDLEAPPGEARPNAAVYGWHPTVDDDGTHVEAHVLQDARTGQIQSIEVEDSDVIPEEPSNDTPGGTAAGLLVATLAAILSARGRRWFH